MTKPVIVIGVGGYSVNLVDTMRDENKAAGREVWRPVGFLDDEPSRRGSSYYGLPVLGALNEAGRFGDAFFVNAIGSTKSAALKPHLIARTAVPSDRFITLRHPSAYVSDSVKLGPGTVITQHCVVMANAVVGMHVKTLPLATISYGATIGDYSTIAGGAVVAAEVRIGSCVYVGANSAIREGITIGDNVILGMGAMVVREVPSGTVAVGIPARPIKPGRQD
ncbi:MAG: NeuD/PglB/VioB family sugar acetyltransferase [Pseudolabrys sp.]